LETVGVTCRATRRDGQPCRVRALPDGYCFAHSPRLAEKRKAAHATGGRHSATRERMARRVATSPLFKVQEVLQHTIAGVLQNRIDPRKATAVAALSGALVRCYQVSVVQNQQDELEERLQRLEDSTHGQRAF
jgi:hypothetical protein